MSIVSKLIHRLNTISYFTPAGSFLYHRCYLLQIPVIHCLSNGFPTLRRKLEVFLFCKGSQKTKMGGEGKMNSPPISLSHSGQLPYLSVMLGNN